MNMKKFIVFLLVLPIALSCSSRRFDLDPHRVEPSFNLAAIWVDGLYDLSSPKVRSQIKNLQKDSCCYSKYSEGKDCYSFSVYRKTDTVTIDISKLHIGSNLRFVKILVGDAPDSSHFEIFTGSGVYIDGRFICSQRSSIWTRESNYLSNIQSSRPVKVTICLFCDKWVFDVNKTMNEYLYEYRRKVLADSLRRNLDSVINTLIID